NLWGLIPAWHTKPATLTSIWGSSATSLMRCTHAECWQPNTPVAHVRPDLMAAVHSQQALAATPPDFLESARALAAAHAVDSPGLQPPFTIPAERHKDQICAGSGPEVVLGQAVHNGGSARGYLADLSRRERSGHHWRPGHDNDRGPDIYAGHRVPGT